MSEKYSISGKLLQLFSLDFMFANNFKKDLYTAVYMFFPYHGNSSTFQHFTISYLMVMLLECGDSL
jgi:hypothetical protein